MSNWLDVQRRKIKLIYQMSNYITNNYEMNKNCNENRIFVNNDT